MNYLLSQIFLCLLAAFLLGAVIGWLWRQITCKKCHDEVLELRREVSNLKKKQFENKPLVKKPPKVAVAKVAEVIAEKPKKIEIKVDDKDFGIPTFLTEPRNGKGDDLKRIKGVGKVLETTLYNKGVYHFDQIAQWSDDNAKWMDTFMQFPGRIEREDWINQAKLLAQGGETEFSKKVDKNKIYD